MSRDSYRHIRSAIFSKRPLATQFLEGEIAVNYNTNTVGVFLRDTAGKVRKIGPAQVSATPPAPVNNTELSDGELWIDKSNPATPVLRYYDEQSGLWLSTAILDSALDTDHIVVGDPSGAAKSYELNPLSFFVDNTPGALEVRLADSIEFGSYGFLSESGVGTRSKVFVATVPSAETDWLEIESFDKTAYRSAKYLVEIHTAGGDISVTEILLSHDGTNTYLSEYGSVGSSVDPLGDFRASMAPLDLVSLEFRRTPNITGDITIRSLQTSLI